MSQQLVPKESRILELWFEPDYKPNSTWFTRDEPRWTMAGGLQIPVPELMGMHLYNCWRLCRKLLIACSKEVIGRRVCGVGLAYRIYYWGLWEKILLDELNKRALRRDPAIMEVLKLEGRGGSTHGSPRLEANDKGSADC